MNPSLIHILDSSISPSLLDALAQSRRARPGMALPGSLNIWLMKIFVYL